MNILQKRFGMVAISMDFITMDQLKEALSLQAEENVNKKTHRPIGQILEKLGYIETEQISKVLLNL